MKCDICGDDPCMTNHIPPRSETVLGNPRPDPLKVPDSAAAFVDRCDVTLTGPAVRLNFGQRIGTTRVQPMGCMVMTIADFNQLLVQGNQAMVLQRTGAGSGIIKPQG